MTPIYNDPRWLTARRRALANSGYRCQNCGASVRGKGAARVDHIQPVRQAPWRAFDPTNLRVLCPQCDNARHSEKGRQGIEKPEIGLDGLPDSWR